MHRPRRSDLHRVDDEPLAREPLQRRGVVAVSEPRLDQADVGRPAPTAVQLPLHDRHGGVDDARRRPRRARAGCTRCRHRPGLAATPLRRRGAARQAWRRCAGFVGRPRRRRRTIVNEYAARRSLSGIGCVRSHTLVITPSVPSDPTNSCVRSGPAAAAGAPPVRTTVPLASTTSRPTTMSSILP